MRLRAYEAGDLDAFTPRADFRADFDAAGGVLPSGPKWTLLGEDGRVLGIAGFKPLPPHGAGLCGAWAYLSALRARDWLAAAKRARIYCAFGQAFGMKGIYATPADTDAAQRLLAFVGFRPSPDDAGVWKFMPDKGA